MEEGFPEGTDANLMADQTEEQEEDSGNEDTAQPTLAETLKAVNKCTASVNTLQELFGGLKKEVFLIRQDIQKTREIIMAAESRINDRG